MKKVHRYRQPLRCCYIETLSIRRRNLDGSVVLQSEGAPAVVCTPSQVFLQFELDVEITPSEVGVLLQDQPGSVKY